jgi:hypothetical protein
LGYFNNNRRNGIPITAAINTVRICMDPQYAAMILIITVAPMIPNCISFLPIERFRMDESSFEGVRVFITNKASR